MLEINAKVIFDMLIELWGMICSKLGMLAFIYALVFAMVLLDLWSGIRKAKKRGEYTSSRGLRRTIEKLAKYYNVIFAFTIADLLQLGFFWNYNIENEASVPLLPFVTAAGAAIVCAIEIKSIYESADKKLKGDAQEVLKQVGAVLKHRDKLEMISAFLETLTHEKTDKPNDDNNGTGE